MGAYCTTNIGIADLNFWCLVYDFQSLLAGVLAGIIALFALIPVRRQLRDSNLQARISHRETLATMLRTGLRRFEKVEESLRKPLSEAEKATMDPEGEPEEINTEAAHYLEQMLSRVLDWYLVVLADTESSEIEACKTGLKTALDSLVKTLADAHWADINDQQQDETYIPDDEWAKIVARCAEAKVEAAERVSAVTAARTALKEAQQDWVRSLRHQIAKLDREISKVS